MIVNKLQRQSFNFIGVDLYILVFTYRQLYIALSKVINIYSLSLLLPQNKDSITANIIYPEVLLRDNVVAVAAIVVKQ